MVSVFLYSSYSHYFMRDLWILNWYETYTSNICSIRAIQLVNHRSILCNCIFHHIDHCCFIARYPICWWNNALPCCWIINPEYLYDIHVNYIHVYLWMYSGIDVNLAWVKCCCYQSSRTIWLASEELTASSFALNVTCHMSCQGPYSIWICHVINEQTSTGKF